MVLDEAEPERRQRWQRRDSIGHIHTERYDANFPLGRGRDLDDCVTEIPARGGNRVGLSEGPFDYRFEQRIIRQIYNIGSPDRDDRGPETGPNEPNAEAGGVMDIYDIRPKFLCLRGGQSGILEIGKLSCTRQVNGLDPLNGVIA